MKSLTDLQGYARAINPNFKVGQAWSWRMSSPVLLASAIHRHGWSFVPNHILPPLIANTAVGAVLYTAYLQTLGHIHEPSSRSTKRVYPPPPPETVFAAGFIAGTIQSILAAPLDALQVRFQAAEMLQGKYKNMWQYGYRKTREIGARGVFAGWTLSFVRDSIGAGAFFTAFEFVKSQCFYSFVSSFYGQFATLSEVQQESIQAQRVHRDRPQIKPHYMLEPTFLLLAGASASVAQALIHHPISRIQELHYTRLEWIDTHAHTSNIAGRRLQAFNLYAAAYKKTFKVCFAVARREGGLRRFLYKNFVMNTLRQVPSTSAGLIIFEVLRRKYGNDDDAVKIPKNGYEIVLL
jgi:hypothetical protein